MIGQRKNRNNGIAEMSFLKVDDYSKRVR